ncbi:ribonuclease P protein component [Citricoccus sp.]|uniref:ribonuclease P protein component n=1 Tax=Citricoccus sp. TaxID=1978372 RepID=UPI0028BD5BD7|nr:ribonuclease P protein component [Citricoccus sp.]
MLPREKRVRTPADFSQTLRSGTRTGRRNVVVSAHLFDPTLPSEADGSAGPVRVGFVVSKAVGNAVVRNRVKRRLRAAVADQLNGPLAQHPGGTVVVRALPPSGSADWDELRKDLDAALAGALRKEAGRRRPADPVLEARSASRAQRSGTEMTA